MFKSLLDFTLMSIEGVCLNEVHRTYVCFDSINFIDGEIEAQIWCSRIETAVIMFFYCKLQWLRYSVQYAQETYYNAQINIDFFIIEETYIDIYTYLYASLAM